MKYFTFILWLIICSFSPKIMAQDELSSINELMQQGQYLQALTRLEKQAIGDSTQAEILQKQAFCNAKLGRINQAKKLYYSALTKKPLSTEILLQIAAIHEKDFNLLETFVTFQKLNQIDSTNTFYWKELARISTRMEHPTQGIWYYKKAISLDNQDLESLVNLANLYLNDLKEPLAAPLITKGFELDSTSIRVRHLRSRLSYRNNDFKMVIKDIEFTMSVGDSAAFYQRLLGTAYYQLDSLPKSMAIFKRLIEVNQETEAIRAGLAFAQLKSTQNNADTLQQAATNFRMAIDLGKSDRLSDYELGMADISDKLGQTEYAIRQFMNLINSRPKAIVRLAEIYEKKKNDREMALIYYQEYLRVCGNMKKQTPDCNFVDSATKKITILKTNNAIEMPKITAAKDSIEVIADTVRHD
jgi:tetratricopeptide (TPR) repeat protein